MRVLAGDIGGTKTALCIADVSTGPLRVSIVSKQRYASADYPGLAPMIDAFLHASGTDRHNIDAACFGVAGPVTQLPDGQQHIKVTNLPWEIDTVSLTRQTGIARQGLINDFEAVGHGVEALAESELTTLQHGQFKPQAPRLVVGPGTGLGMALLIWQGDHYAVISSEGGHADFAPTSRQQVKLLEFLMRRHEHVSYERVASGPGLAGIHEFLCEDAGQAVPSAIITAGDPAAAISYAAQMGKDVLAVRAVELFVEICGAYAGNIALIALTYGGIYIAGGIAPRLIATFRSGRFMNAFNDKGRMSPLLAGMPVQVVLNPDVGLLGAAVAAGRL